MPQTQTPVVRRSRLAISLRLLFVLVGVAAVAFAWLHYERRKVHARRQAYARFEERSRGSTGWNIPPWDDEPTRPAWLRWITSDDLPGELHMATIHEATEEDFAAIRSFPELRELYITIVKVEPGEIDLSGLDRLERLTIWTNDCPDEALEFLEELPSLTFLELAGADIKGRGLKSIRHLEKLKNLKLNPAIEDEGFVHIAPLKDLEILDLVGTKITDKGLAHLGELPQLTELGLNKSKVTGTGLSKVHLPRLKYLDLRGCREFRDEDVAVLTKMPLRSLSLGPYITDEAIPHLQAITTLENLFLNQTHLSEAGLERLRESLPNADITQSVPPEPFPP